MNVRHDKYPDLNPVDHEQIQIHLLKYYRRRKHQIRVVLGVTENGGNSVVICLHEHVIVIHCRNKY